MSKKEKTFYPTGIHGIRRGDIYYVDFGKIEDVVGREAAKKRPVLIVQNNLGNKVSDTVKANNIEFEPIECHHTEPCLGTCLMCDYEVAYLDKKLQEKQERGENIELKGLMSGKDE